jgi:site-specific DNA-cytosine methylase
MIEDMAGPLTAGMSKGPRGTEAVESNHVVPVISPALNTQSGSHHAPDTKAYVASSDCVRRLTPIECERLQGFPDNFTCIPWRNKLEGDCPDSPRYKALGNSMAVPVMRWIGERIQKVEQINDR